MLIVATILVFGGGAILAGTISVWFSRSARVQITLNRIAGGVFVALAVKLVTTGH